MSERGSLFADTGIPRSLTADEERELSMERLKRWAREGVVTPFTPAEARWHARRFIESNGRYNLVRLLAEAYLSEVGG